MEDNILNDLKGIYQNYKDKFQKVIPGSFHNCLWQIMVNEIHKNKKKCFTSVYNNDGKLCLALVINKEKGYFEMAYFETMTYDKSLSISSELNEKIFKLGKEEVNRIVLSSMNIK